jgi:1-acyl-sn-glycerol-3-phosphate acyltransferase
MTVPLQDLFFTSHIKPLNFWRGLILLYYIPIGVTLLITRFVLLSILLSILFIGTLFRIPVTDLVFHQRICKVLLAVFGLYCRFKNGDALKTLKKPVIIASNHRTAFDVIPFLLYPPLDVLIDRGFFDGHMISRKFIDFVANIMGTIKIDSHHDESKRQQQRESIVQHLNQSQRPLVYFPEGWDTNGTGLLIYQKFLFSLGLTVLPVALKVNVLGLPLVPGKLGSSIFKEIAWMFFSPLYIYDIELLEPTTKTASEDPDQFANRVQHIVAHHMGVVATKYSKKDALQYRLSLLNKQHRH